MVLASVKKAIEAKDATRHVRNFNINFENLITTLKCIGTPDRYGENCLEICRKLNFVFLQVCVITIISSKVVKMMENVITSLANVIAMKDSVDLCVKLIAHKIIEQLNAKASVDVKTVEFVMKIRNNVPARQDGPVKCVPIDVQAIDMVSDV